MRIGGDDGSGNDVDLQFTSQGLVLGNVLVGSLGENSELRVIRNPACQVIFREDCKSGALRGSFAYVRLCR